MREKLNEFNFEYIYFKKLHIYVRSDLLSPSLKIMTIIDLYENLSVD